MAETLCVPATLRRRSGSRALFVNAFDAGPDAAEHFVGVRSNRGGDFANVDAIVTLAADDDDFVAGVDLDVRHVDGNHVHIDGPDDGRARSANQHGTRTRHPAIEAVSVARRNDRDAPRLRDCPPCSIADDFTHFHPLDGNDAAAQRHHRFQWNRRRERWWDYAVHHEPGPYEVIPDARIAQCRGAVRSMPQSWPHAELREPR